MISAKRNRTTNFSEPEVELMFKSIQKHNDILFGQVFPKITLKQKEEAWQKVLADVNANSMVRRTLPEIKVKWKNIKQKLSNEKKKNIGLEECPDDTVNKSDCPEKISSNISVPLIQEISEPVRFQKQLPEKSICRTCLNEEKNFKSIFEENINEKLIKLANIKVHVDDGLPLEICKNCFTQLIQAYNFQTQVLTSDIKLRKPKECKVKTEQMFIKEEILFAIENTNTNQTQVVLQDNKSHNLLENVTKNYALAHIQEANAQEAITKNNVLDCKICGQIFISKSRLVKHCKSHKGNFICEECGKVFQNYCNLESHLLVHGIGEKKYGCDLCQMKFVSASRLVMHKRKHTGERPLICPVCGKGFAYPRNLSAHYLTHTGETKYECNICNRKFSQSQNLIRHKIVHTGERPYVCTTCGLAYTSLGGLKIHTRNHTNERPYCCNICSKSFTSQASLTSHKRKHSEERTFLCTVCGKSFKTKTELATHFKCHSGAKPHACEYANCNKRFRTHSNLSVHKRTHTGEKKYICSICLKAFASTSVLKQHMNIHTGTKAHVCAICGYRFTQGSTLKTHMKIHEIN